MKDELLKILEDLLLKCKQERVTAEGRLSQADDQERAVELVIKMLKEEK